MPTSDSPRPHPDSDKPLHQWLARLADALSLCPDERYRLVAEAIRNLANDAECVEPPGTVLDVPTFKARLAARNTGSEDSGTGWPGAFVPGLDGVRYAARAV